MRTKVVVAAIAALVFVTSGVAFGATYNFYFNNTEQGNNGQANPSLTVTSDGKSGGTELKPTPQNSGEPAVVPDPVAPVPGSPAVDAAPIGPYGGPPGASTAVKLDQVDYDRYAGFRHFYVGPELTLLTGAGIGTSTFAPGLGFGYAFNGDIAVHAYGGRYQTSDQYSTTVGSSYYDGSNWVDNSYPSVGYSTSAHFYGGADFDFTPFHTGRGDHSLFDLGVLVGANSIRVASDNDYGLPSTGTVNLYIGALVRLNLGNNFSIPISYTVGSNASALQAGFSVRL